MKNVSILHREVLPLALGTWVLGGCFWGGADEKEIVGTIHEALERGIRLLDTAPIYGFGKTEELVGRAVKGSKKRDEIVLMTKFGISWKEQKLMRDSRKEAIFREVDASLARLKTDRIDLYQLHWPDPVSPLDETAEALSLLLQAGKIGAVGISNCTLDELKALRARVPISAVQSPFNLFERGIEGELVPFCKENKIPVLGYGALCRGLLSGAMSAGAAFRGDDLRTFDPKYKEPLYSQYLACANELSEWVKRKHRRTLLELSIRWAIDKGAIPLWGPRNRSQLIDPKAIDGWKLKSGDLQEIDAILARRIAEPLGVEFLTPPCRDSA